MSGTEVDPLLTFVILVFGAIFLLMALCTLFKSENKPIEDEKGEEK